MWQGWIRPVYKGITLSDFDMEKGKGKISNKK
jgi:hypothetical protein